jgi:gamma-butyrobetaine dioxygenase
MLAVRCGSCDDVNLLSPERSHWDSELLIPSASFEEVLTDDKAALDWLLALRRVGVVYLRGAPSERGQVARLSERIGFLRLTFYG